MTRTHITEIATEAVVFLGSGLFLGWYILAKLACWPWGAGSY